ncbi:hypothetical protein OPV22_020749 [Ensete ventricosum]|uniref:Transcriptional corepressor SEUSS n=1 Tax=Ensete ventricosum TaxID=4639 RepID=A0AAV8QP13_ENSVE|nr:hypothetical protein OPV22_020749 [Ensete ventricosum]
MVPSGPPTPVGGGQSVPASLLRTNSAMSRGAQPGSLPSQQPASPLVSPRTQFDNIGNSNGNNMNLLGNYTNISSLLNQSTGYGVPVSSGGFSAASLGLQQRGGVGSAVEMLSSAELDPLSFTSASSLAQRQSFQNPSRNQLALDRLQNEHREGMQKFRRQFSLPHNQQQMLRGGLGNMGPIVPVKLEPQMDPSDKTGPSQNLQTLCSSSAIKLEPQQLHSVRSLGPVKLERQHSDTALVLQQQQHHQLLQMSRPPSQAAAAAQMSLLQQQRMLQLQQQQQQQILQTLPQQRNQLQQQLQQAFIRPQIKPTLYEPGMCARRLTQYMYHQQHRPEDNNINFWRKFVAEYFAPNAKKRWCVSLYGSGRQTTGVFPQDAWHCEVCNRKPGRGFETTFEVLPRLYQIKYASGTLEELLYIDMPREYQNALGQIVLDYGKAIQESVYEQLRVVREGQLRIVFSAELKICSWEFCARQHEELVPRRLLIPQVSQLGAAAQKYQNTAQNSPPSISAQELQNTCNSFVVSARQLAKTLEVPLVNDLGYTKRYIRCLQISEVVNSMKDLIDYSRETRTGPMDSLISFPRKASFGLHPQQTQLPEDHQMVAQNSTHNDQSSSHVNSVQISGCNGAMNVENSLGSLTTTCTTTSIVELLHQNSLNSRQGNLVSSTNDHSGGGSVVPIPSASSNSLLHSQPSASCPFPSQMPSALNGNNAPTSLNLVHLNSVPPPANMSMLQQPPVQSHEANPTGSQSSVQQILQEMMSSQLNGEANLEDELKGLNGVTPALNGVDCLVRNGMANNSGYGEMGFSAMGMTDQSTTASGLRVVMANDTMPMAGRVGMNHLSQYPHTMNHQQLQDMESRVLCGSGHVNGFNNLQYDWKSSP